MLRKLPKLPPRREGSVVDEAGADEDGGLADGPALREILVGLRYAVARRDLLGSYLAGLRSPDGLAAG